MTQNINIIKVKKCSEKASDEESLRAHRNNFLFKVIGEFFSMKGVEELVKGGIFELSLNGLKGF